MTGIHDPVTALFGGSFDPVHNGHVNAVKGVLKAVPETERIIVMPAGRNPFKRDIDMTHRASGQQRLEMCRIAMSEIPRCQVSDYEIKKGGISYTSATLEHLRKMYKGGRLMLIVGTDSLESLPGWHEADRIMAAAEIGAVVRSDSDGVRIKQAADKIRMFGGQVRIIPMTPFDISSTEIRKKILNNEKLTYYMDEKVAEYIYRNKIYRG